MLKPVVPAEISRQIKPESNSIFFVMNLIKRCLLAKNKSRKKHREKMKYFCLAAIFILLGTFGISYAQETGAEDAAVDDAGGKIVNEPENTGAKSLYWYDRDERKQKGVMEEIKILLQMVQRDKEGNLISYIESTQNLLVRPSSLHWYLMQQHNKNYVMIDNQPYEVIHWPGNEPPAKKSHYSMAMYILMAKVPNIGPTGLVTMNHEAYQVEPGDKLEVYWTAFLPINPSGK